MQSFHTYFRRAALGAALFLLPLAGLAATPRHHAPRSAAQSALYIANVGGGDIVRCDGASGKALAVLSQNQMAPVGMALGPDEKLYVTNDALGNIMRFDPRTGRSLGVFIPAGRGGLGEPVCMAFGPDGNLYVSNWGHMDIRRYNGRTGAFLGVFAPRGHGSLSHPGDLTFGPDGNLYVTNNFANSVLRFNGRTGASLGSFVKPKSGGLLNPQNLAFSPRGDLYVGGPKGVLKYSGKNGAFVRVFVKPSPHLSNVGGLTFGPDGNLYVGDWQKNDVVRYNGRTGAFLGVFVAPSSGLMANRYILFGPRGSGGVSPAAHLKAMEVTQKAFEARQPKLLAVGTPAPDFTAVTADGQPVHLSDFKGQPVVLDFWSTWCGPCQMSMPHLEKVYEQVKDKGVAVLGVCVWDQKPAYVKWLAAHKGAYNFPTAFDPAGQNMTASIASRLYHVSGIPTQYIIDKDGNVAAANVGYGEGDHELEQSLAKIGISVPDQSASAK